MERQPDSRLTRPLGLILGLYLQALRASALFALVPEEAVHRAEQPSTLDRVEEGFVGLTLLLLRRVKR